MRRFVAALPAALLALSLVAGGMAAGGPPALAFYVDGAQYRTVGTPTDLSGTGAPASTFDNLYDFGNPDLLNVAAAAPGDTDYNGGRWMVFAVTFTGEPVQLFSEEDVLAAEAAGQLTISDEPVKQFACPVIKVSGG